MAPPTSLISAAGAGTIAVSGSRTLGGMTFAANGYDIIGGTLGFGSSQGTLTMTNAAEINSLISGTAGMMDAGTGTLTLGGTAANTISGGIWNLASGGGQINYIGSATSNVFGTTTLT